jgi:hypothetical protein
MARSHGAAPLTLRASPKRVGGILGGVRAFWLMNWSNTVAAIVALGAEAHRPRATVAVRDPRRAATVLRPLSYHHATSPSTPSHHVCQEPPHAAPTRRALLDWDAPTPAGQPTYRVCTPRHCYTTNLRRSCGGWTRGWCCVHRHRLWSRVWPPPLRGGEAHPHTAGCGGTLPVRVEGRGDGQRAACSLRLGFSGGDGPHASAAAACGGGGGHG